MKTALTDEERELSQFTPSEPVSFRRATNTTRTINGLLRSLGQLESAVARKERDIAITINGVSVVGDGMWLDLCRVLARQAHQRLRYWLIWAERYVELDEETRRRITAAEDNFQMFAGNGNA